MNARTRVLSLCIVAATALLAVAFAPADSGPIHTADSAVVYDSPVEAPVAEPILQGNHKGEACCDPAEQPGVGDNPFCFEGASCCSDGQWRCNNPDASPSCDLGEVCDGSCGDKNAACSTGADCCSGTCKRNGRCR